jgi:hypothetical protein
MSEPISKRIRVNSLSMASGPPYELITVNFTMLEGPQQFNGSVIINKAEVKKLNITVGDELTLTLTALEK